MKLRVLGLAAGALATAALAFACSNAYLFDERRSEQVPLDRGLSLEGEVCTPGTNEVLQPIKIAIAMDASLSMQVSDPFGTRALAAVELIRALPREAEVYISVLLFAGSTSTYLTKDAMGNDGFAQVIAMTDADLALLQAQILAFVNPDTTPNRDSTDFLKPLSDLFALISRDISLARLNPSDPAAGRARYSVIFLTDGHPSICQDDQLICNGSPPVQRIRDLRDLAGDVRFHTVHAFSPLSPVSSLCDLDGGSGQFIFQGCTIYCQAGATPIPCPNLIINQDVDRLQRMAAAGNGVFRSFRNNEPISFLNFNLGQVRRAFTMKELVATNFSAPPGSPALIGDTDGDRLTDDEEAQAGTDPFERDTDTDGFSDGVEVHFGAPFNPAQVPLPDGGGVDPGCPLPLRPLDTDCDGLLDCDEQLIGTNGGRTDSDDDGVPDSMEWQLRTQPSSPDLEQDPDVDGMANRQEVRMHLNPQSVDNSNITVDGYRYRIEASGPPGADGSQCYKFRIDNVALAPTLQDNRDGGTGRGAGFNDIMLSVAMVPSDDPTARTLVKTFRVNTPRYPVGGIKSPADGVIPIAPSDFVELCGTAPGP